MLMKKVFGSLIGVVGFVHPLNCTEASVSTEPSFSSGINYHSALKEQQMHVQMPSVKCDIETELLLRKKFDDTTYFLTSKNIDLSNSEYNSRLIAEYKKIFYNISDDMIPMYEEYEENMDEDNISLIIEANEGLPEAATKLQSLYEVTGDYKHSFFWALVSCRLGYKTGAEAIGRLLLLMKKEVK